MVVGYQITYICILAALSAWAVIEFDNLWKAAIAIAAILVTSNVKALLETTKIKDSVLDLAASSREMIRSSQAVIADLQGQIRSR